MAEAAKKIRVVQEEGLSLDLSMDEVRTLYAVLSRVGGGYEHTPRKHVSAISRAIEVAVGASSYADKEWAEPEYGMLGGSLIVGTYKEGPEA